MKDPAEAIEQLRQATERLQRRTAQLAEAREQHESERAAAVEKIAAERRRGEHGREWQVLQQRIDLGQTTEFAVVQGLDLSAEARAVRKQMGESLGRLADEQEREGEGPVQMTPELAEAQDRLVSTLQRLRELTRANGLG